MNANLLFEKQLYQTSIERFSCKRLIENFFEANRSHRFHKLFLLNMRQLSDRILRNIVKIFLSIQTTLFQCCSTQHSYQHITQPTYHAMSLNLSTLSQYQIRRFFEENTSVTLQQCDELAQQLAGRSVTPTPSQGGTSYTVEGGNVVVQFRAPNSPLDMKLLQGIEQAYAGFVPGHRYQGDFGGLIVYTMDNMGGSCMYLARTELQDNNHHLLRSTIDDYARPVNPPPPFQGRETVD